MIRALVTTKIQSAIDALVESGRLPRVAYPAVEVQDTKQPEHGDLATNWAMVAIKSVSPGSTGILPALEAQAGCLPSEPGQDARQTSAAKMAALPGNPRALAELLVNQLITDPDFEKAEVAGPGFVNMTLTAEVCAEVVRKVRIGSEGAVLDNPTHFARSSSFHDQTRRSTTPQRINLEFVSVNPNGPITIGSGRGAAYGSTLANVLQVAGHQIHREYYINDGVNSEQMRQVAESVRTKVLEKLGIQRNLPVPIYKADYVNTVSLAVSDSGVIKRGESKMWATYALLDSILRSLSDHGKLRSGEPKGPAELATWYKRASDRHHGRGEVPIPQSGIQKLIFQYYEIAQRSGIYKSTKTRFRIVQLAAVFLAHRNRSQGTKKRPSISDLALASKMIKKVASHLKYRSARQIDFPIDRRVLEEYNIAPTTSQIAPSIAELLGFSAQSMPIEWFQQTVQRIMIEQQRRDLAAFGVTFDTWFSEQSLHDSGKVQEHIDALVQAGVADEEPTRTKLKLGKGGVIEEVLRDEQVGEGDEVGSEQLAVSSEIETANCRPPTANTLWLRSTLFGDDMDRVLRRKDGRLTYIASDVAYHADKFNRGSKPDPEGNCGRADKLITVLGPDHHGYIGRLHAVVAAELMSEGGSLQLAVGSPDAAIYQLPTANSLSGPESELYKDDPSLRDACQAALASSKEKLEVLIFQLVRFMKDGKPSPMRKRDGNIYALIDLINEIGEKVKPSGTTEEKQEAGKDVARFFYLMRHHNTTFDFDLDLAAKQSDENPVFYVQYAHARVCSVLEKASTTANCQLPTANSLSFPSTLHPKERSLILKIADLPYEVARCAEDYAVSRLTTYAIELARTYHGFYDACRVIDTENPETSQWRIQLCEATKSALKATLDILGVSAPERMERDVVES